LKEGNLLTTPNEIMPSLETPITTAPDDSAPAAPKRKPKMTLRASSGWVPLKLSELWRYRDLMFSLAGRDLRLRYKQTALGVIWVVLQPLMAAGIFSFVFGKVAQMPSDGLPYFLFSYAGLMGWNLFSATVSKVSGSLVGNSHLISKVFFPRLVLPLSSIPSVLVDFAVAVVMMIVLMFVYHVVPGWNLLLLPGLIALLLLFATGIGLCTASLMVSYRDVAYVLPVALQILLYACPIAYAVSAVPEHLRYWYDLNPLSGLLEAMRYSLLGRGTMHWSMLGYATAASLIMTAVGLFSFKRMERRFADII
jgi:lipopolysaccharide transport system permease protein